MSKCRWLDVTSPNLATQSVFLVGLCHLVCYLSCAGVVLVVLARVVRQHVHHILTRTPHVDYTGRGFSSWEQLAADPEVTEPQIRPLVDALNQTGWARTVFSCAGHPDEPDSIARGRRQAHVDLVVSDDRRWRQLVDALRKACHPLVRITEGSLGPIPAWLLQNLPAPFDASSSSPRLSLLRGNSGWHYRRLVIEPVPYDAPSATVRASLDSALALAVAKTALLDY